MRFSAKKLGFLLATVALIAVAGGYIYLSSDKQRVKRATEELITTDSSENFSRLSHLVVKIDPKITVPILLDGLNDKRLKNPSGIVVILGGIGPAAKNSVPELLKLLQQEEVSDTVKIDIVNTLNKIKDERAIAPIFALVKRNTFSAAVEYAIENFTLAIPQNFGPTAKNYVPDLLALLQQEEISDEVKLYAIRTLGKIKDKRAITPISAQIQKWKSVFRWHWIFLAVEALKDMGDPIVKNTISVVMADMVDMVWEANRYPLPYSYICEEANKLDANLWGPVQKECEDHKGLQNSSLNLLSPADKSKFSGSIFRWEILNKSPGATYCSNICFDKGENPFDSWNEFKRDVGQRTQAEIYVDDGHYEWGVIVVACMGEKVDCAKPPPKCVRLYSDIRSFH